MMLHRATSLLLLVLSVSGTAATAVQTEDGGSSSSLRTAAGDTTTEEDPMLGVQLFRTWMTTHEKEYTTQEEETERLQIWLNNHGTSLSVLSNSMPDVALWEEV